MDEIDWAQLTRSTTKRSLYSQEIYLREAHRDMANELCHQLSYFLHSYALMIIKPDGLATGKLEPVLHHVRAQGFAISVIREFRMTRHHWRELWRYQLNAASLDRLAVADAFLTDQTALLVIVHDAKQEAAPATVRLTALKGSPSPRGRDEHTLRSLIGQTNRVLSFIHVADEPADLLRELGIILSRSERRQMVGRLGHHLRSAHEDGSEIAKVIDSHSLPLKEVSTDASLRRVEIEITAQIDAATIHNSAAAESLQKAILSMKAGRSISMLGLLESLEAIGASCDSWDLAVLGAHYSPHDEPGVAKLIEGVKGSLWGV